MNGIVAASRRQLKFNKKLFYLVSADLTTGVTQSDKTVSK